MVLALGLGGWFVLRGRSGSEASVSTGTDRLPTDPQQLYSITFDESVDGIRESFGNPDRFLTMLRVEGENELRVFDRTGAERWRRSFDRSAGAVMVGDDVLVGTVTFDDPESQLLLLNGDNGDEKWATTVDSYSAIAIQGKHAYLVDDRQGLDPSAVAVYNLADGQKVAARSFDFLGPVLSSLRVGEISTLTNGDFVVTDNGKTFVVNDRLEDISEPLSLEVSRAAAFMDGEILGFDDGKLIRFGTDGKKIAAADLNVQRVEWLAGIEGGKWFYLADGTCGVVDFAGDRADFVWELENCLITSPEVVVRFDDKTPYAWLQVRATGSDLVDLDTGEGSTSGETDPADNWIVGVYANGYVKLAPNGLTAFEMPGDQQLYSVELEDFRDYRQLDNGYAVIDEESEPLTVAVYG